MKKVLISILARIKGNVNANGTIAALTEIKKFFTTEGETRVYISGRCVKYCIKQRLREKGFELSPLERRERVLQSKGNPILYIDDDLFGFMVTEAAEVARKRFAPIKTDGIVALRHCEITRDFAGRFDPTGKEMPSPFEIEVADFIGQNNWILTENIGKFEKEELTEEIISKSPIKLEKIEDGKNVHYYLPSEFSEEDKKNYGRKNRLKAFLEILLKERYAFPRSATNLHLPQYYYIVILFTNRLLPLFASINYEIKNERVLLDINKIENLISMLNGEEKIKIIDFEHILDEELKLRRTKYEEELKKLQQAKEEIENKLKRLNSIEVIESYKIDKVIDEISEYLIGT